MSLENFRITDVNPNANHGVAGCLCSPDRETYCDGPYVVFHGACTDAPYAPHAVVSEACCRAAVKQLDRHIADAAPHVDSTAVEESEDDGPPV